MAITYYYLNPQTLWAVAELAVVNEDGAERVFKTAPNTFKKVSMFYDDDKDTFSVDIEGLVTGRVFKNKGEMWDAFKSQFPAPPVAPYTLKGYDYVF